MFSLRGGATRFGCHPLLTTISVATVGSIHIVYHYGDPGHTPKPGYELLRRREVPQKQCP